MAAGRRRNMWRSGFMREDPEDARRRRPPKQAPPGPVPGGRRSAAHRHLHGARVAGEEREAGLLAHTRAEGVRPPPARAREAVALAVAAGPQARRAERHPPRALLDLQLDDLARLGR